MTIDHRLDIVFLPSLFITATVLERHAFIECNIVGPAIVTLLDGNVIVDNRFRAPDGDVESLLIEVPEGRLVVGALGLQHCTFERCVFDGIGFLGPKSALDMIRASGPPRA